MRIIPTGPPEENQFESIDDFKWCMECGGEVEFEWRGKIYSITHPEGRIHMSEAFKQETEQVRDTADELLDCEIDGEKLRDIITKIHVLDRTI